ncbi:hypothetical protein PFISCL1PPCAC_19197, partial [Pristionchus fissidentatus]
PSLLVQGMKRIAQNCRFWAIQFQVDEMDSKAQNIMEVAKLISAETFKIRQSRYSLETLRIDLPFIMEYCENRRNMCLSYVISVLHAGDLRELWKKMRSGSLDIDILTLSVTLEACDAFLQEISGRKVVCSRNNRLITQFIRPVKEAYGRVDVYGRPYDVSDVHVFDGLFEVNFTSSTAGYYGVTKDEFYVVFRRYENEEEIIDDQEFLRAFPE